MPEEKTSDPLRKTVVLDRKLMEAAERRYAPKFGAFNWSAYVCALIERDVKRDEEREAKRKKA